MRCRQDASVEQANENPRLRGHSPTLNQICGPASRVRAPQLLSQAISRPTEDSGAPLSRKPAKLIRKRKRKQPSLLVHEASTSTAPARTSCKPPVPLRKRLLVSGGPNGFSNHFRLPTKNPVWSGPKTEIHPTRPPPYLCCWAAVAGLGVVPTSAPWRRRLALLPPRCTKQMF